MTITESQRRTLDLMAESAGWNWADVEALSQEAYSECVAGLSVRQANAMLEELALTVGIEPPTAPWEVDTDASA
jgi:hypothetical protein